MLLMKHFISFNLLNVFDLDDFVFYVFEPFDVFYILISKICN